MPRISKNEALSLVEEAKIEDLEIPTPVIEEEPEQVVKNKWHLRKKRRRRNYKITSQKSLDLKRLNIDVMPRVENLKAKARRIAKKSATPGRMLIGDAWVPIRYNAEKELSELNKEIAALKIEITAMTDPAKTTALRELNKI